MSVELVNRIMPTIFAAEEESNRSEKTMSFGQAVRKGVEEGLDLQTIEKALRAGHRTAYLIARRPESYFHAQHVQPRLPGDTRNQKYWVYAASGPHVERELFKESQSYEENFAKLKEAGFAAQISNAPFQDGVKKPHQWMPIDPPKHF